MRVNVGERWEPSAHALGLLLLGEGWGLSEKSFGQLVEVVQDLDVAHSLVVYEVEVRIYSILPRQPI